MADLDSYSFKTVWSEPDQEWVGLCDAFDPALNWMDPSEPAARQGIRRLVAEALEVIDQLNEPAAAPKP